MADGVWGNWTFLLHRSSKVIGQALVPPSYFNLIRFHGVFGPNALLRPRVVPGSGNTAGNTAAEPRQLQLFTLDNYLCLLGARPANDAPRASPGRRA